MNKIKKTAILLASSLLIGLTAQAQEDVFVDFSYKMGKTNMSHAYTTYTPNAEEVYNLAYHKDGFYQTNFRLYLGEKKDDIYYSVNLDGIFYLMAEMFIDHNKKPGPLRAEYRKYDDLKEENEYLKENETRIANGHTFRTLRWGGDYKYADWDIAFGSENIKGGLNYGLGALGESGNMSNGYNGLGVGNVGLFGIDGVRITYHQIGLKGHYFQTEDLPIKASFGISKLISTNKKEKIKRKGYGIDMEVKYFFTNSNFKPYISAYFEYKKFKKDISSHSYFRNGTPAFSYQIPALRTTAFGISLGFLITDE